MELIINTESPAARAIMALAHAAGTAEIYINTLSRMSNAVLFNQDDMGMDDTETLDTIRVLSLLRSDIKDIATDKTIARSLERAVNQYDDIQIIPAGPFSVKVLSHNTTPLNTWHEMITAIKSGIEYMGAIYSNNDANREIAVKLDDIGNIIDRMGDVTEWADTFAENPEFTKKAGAEAIIRTYSQVASLKAAHTFEILKNIQTDMVREGYPAEKIAEITEAIELQKNVAEILKRNLAVLTASEAKEEGGDE
ncbi:hypothetical protein [uncultured Muribaculum sp.]|uniref:hypothetical protein n=1 Tax=uncultured Muribaculum sp. TaxID=1918613 RepID=UPI0025AF0628|nr:hypothetical protein [uncultured Muribaculum sp.]